MLLLSSRMLTRLVHDNTDTFYRISMLYYVMGEEEDSLRYGLNYQSIVVLSVCVACPGSQNLQCFNACLRASVLYIYIAEWYNCSC